MNFDMTGLFSMGTMQRCFLIWLLVILSQEKKKAFIPHLICSTLLFFASLYLLPRVMSGVLPLLSAPGRSVFLYSFADSIFNFTLCCLIVSLLLLLSCEMSIPQALYVSVCIYVVQTIAFDLFAILKTDIYLGLGTATETEDAAWLKFILIPVTYYALYLAFLSKFDRNKFNFGINCLLFAAVILLENTLSTYITCKHGDESFLIISIFLVNEIVLLCFTFAIQLLIQEEEKYKSLAVTELRLRQELQQQRMTFEENVENLNRKFHDFKHVLSTLREEDNRQKHLIYTRNIEKDISIYDSRISTGNSALDTIITEAILNCEKNGIQWTCMADGQALEFMEAVDMCRLIGNALDNAVESVMKIDNPDMRFISLNIWRRNQLVFIKIDNYCVEMPEFKNGLPTSTKLQKSEHGYGMQSIRFISEQYDGDFKISIDRGIFSLNIMFPIP